MGGAFFVKSSALWTCPREPVLLSRGLRVDQGFRHLGQRLVGLLLLLQGLLTLGHQALHRLASVAAGVLADTLKDLRQALGLREMQFKVLLW